MGLIARGAGWLRRLVLAAAGAGGLVGLACAGASLTTASEAVNLVFEPLSLLLLPGLVVELMRSAPSAHKAGKGLADNHTFSADGAVLWSLVLYFLALYGWMWWRERRPLTKAFKSR